LYQITIRVPRHTKCALCSEPHTASYEEYTVFTKLSKNRRKSPSFKTYCHPVLNHNIPSINKITSSPNKKQKRSYANVTANTSSSKATPESLISKFHEDFRAIINPLLLLLNTIFNHLLPFYFPIPSPKNYCNTYEYILYYIYVSFIYNCWS
jgi:hypothetical protein